MKSVYQYEIDALKNDCEFLRRKLNDEIIVREDIIYNERRLQDHIIEDHVKARERHLVTELDFKNK